MKRIVYAGSELLTGDAIADSLMSLSQALADVRAAASVDIPVILPSGARGVASLLVGPASQIVAVASESDTPELIDDDVVTDLESRVRRLRPSAMTDDEPPPGLEWADDL
ncbi:hypothetical protein [Microbacterium awajiense]